MQRSRLRLVVADDDDRFATLITTLVEADGRFEVVARARNGAEAIGLVAMHRPDCVLMDIDMPVIDGIEATRRLAQLVPATRVVIVSGSTVIANALQARDHGAADLVSKSRVHDDLVETVAAALAA